MDCAETIKLLISEVVSQEGLTAMRRMGMQQDHEGALARSRYEKLTGKEWTSPNNISQPEVKKIDPTYAGRMQAKKCVDILQSYDFVFERQEIFKSIRTNIYRYAGKNSLFKGLTISVDSTSTWRVYQNKFFEAVGHTPNELKKFLELCRG